ncbi:MAG: hypothetical protein QM539_03465 [Alphaproteobacteria bacterium]|nr:hypothetical protein [Alphaproteobacteria bacterium]
MLYPSLNKLLFLWTSKTDFLDCTEDALNTLILKYPAAIGPKILLKKYQYLQYENSTLDSINLWIHNNLMLSMLLQTKETDLEHSLTQYHKWQSQPNVIDTHQDTTPVNIDNILELAKAEADFEDAYKKKMHDQANQDPIVIIPSINFEPPVHRYQNTDSEPLKNQGEIDTLINNSSVSDNYFQSQGIEVKNEFPETIRELNKEPKSNLSFLGWIETLNGKHKTHAKASNNLNKDVSPQIPKNFEQVSNFSKVAPTETMALILEQQGKHNIAIEIYLKLSAEIPEKSCYFAEKIKQIKNLNS